MAKAPGATWMKNVAKSLGYTGVDILKSTMPELTGTLKSAKDTISDAKAALDSVKDIKGRKKFDALAKINTDEYLSKAIQLKENIISDIKSGNLNNKSREDEASMGGMFNEDDFDFDFDFEDEDGNFDESEADVVVPNVNINANINKNNPMVKAVQQETATMTSIAAATANRDVAISQAQMGLSAELASKISGNIGTVNDNIGMLVDFNRTVMDNYAKASLSYYESSLTAMTSILEELKKMTSVKSNDDMYGNAPASISDIFSYGSGLNIQGYIKHVAKNVKNKVSNSMVGSMGSMIGGTGVLDAMIANPLGTVMSMAINLPEAMTNIMGEFDNTLNSFLSAAIGKFNDMASDMSGSSFASDVIRNIAEVLGFKTSKKTTLDLSTYEKGPVPFDGIVKKSIVEVIPGYLSKILAAVSKDDPITYDYKSGTWKNVHKERNEFYRRVHDDILYEYDDYSDLKDNIRDATMGDPEKQRKLLEKMESAMVKLANYNGVIDYRDTTSATGGLLSIFNSITDPKNPLIKDSSLEIDEIELISKILSESLTNQQKMKMFAGSNKFAAAEVYAETLRRIERDDPTKASILGSGLYDNLNIPRDKDGKRTEGSHFVDPRLAELKEKLEKDGLTEIPSEYSSVTLDYEAKNMLRSNQKKKGKSGFKLFKNEKNPINRFLNKVLDKPVTFLSEQVEKMGNRMHDLIFGKKDDEDDDRPLAQKFKDGIDKFFDNVKDKLFGDDGFFTKIKESDFYKGITSKLGDVGKYIFGVQGASGLYSGGLLSGTANTFKGYGNRVKDYFTREDGVFDRVKSSTSSLFGGSSGKDGDLKDFTFTEDGRRVTKVSSAIDKGADAIKQGFQNFTDLIFGPKTYKDGTANQNYINIDYLMGNIKENAPDALAHGIMGAGAGLLLSSTSSGLLSGLVLGPIGGAVVGVAGTFLAKSQTFQDMMFGYDDEKTGKRVEGFISDKTQEWFKDNKKTLIGGASIGGIAGLMGAGALPAFLLGGPISGAILGIAGGLVYKSEGFQNFLFGEMDKDGNRSGGAIDSVKKFLGDNLSKVKGKDIDVKKVLGTIGAGTIAGMGIFGIIGASPLLGAVAGIGAGLIASSEKWRTKVFGEEDEKTGKRSGGLLDKAITKVTEKVINPIAIMGKSAATYTANWFDKRIKEPVIHTAEYAFEGIKGAGASLKEAFSESNIGKKLDKYLFTPIRNIFTTIGNALLGFGKKALGLAGKFALWAISAPINGVGALVRGTAGLFIDSDTKDKLKQRHKDRVAANDAKAAERNNALNEFKESLNKTSVVGRFTEGLSRGDKRRAEKQAQRALANKYGKDYSKLNTVEKAQIGVAETQAQDINSIRDIEKESAGYLRDIRNAIYDGVPDRVRNGSNDDDDIGVSNYFNTDDMTKINIGGSDDSQPTWGSDAVSGDNTGYNFTVNTDNPLSGSLDASGGHGKNKGEAVIKGDGTVDPDSVSPDKNPVAAQVSSGVGASIKETLLSTKSPFSKVLSMAGAVSKVAAPFAAKAALIGVAAIGVIKLFTDPIGFFTGVIGLIGDVLGALFSPVIEWAKSKVTEKMDDGSQSTFATDIATTAETIESINSSLTSNPDQAYNEELFQAVLESDKALDSKYDITTYSRMSPDYKDLQYMNYQHAKAIMSFAPELREKYGITGTRLKDYEDQANMDPDLYTGTAYTEFAKGAGNVISGRWFSNAFAKWTGATSTSTAELQSTFEKSSDVENGTDNRSRAIGESNVDENSGYYLHKGEGVLTAAANHLFGGAETTAGILNAYARHNTGRQDASALQSIIGGTLGTSNNISLDSLSESMFGGTDSMSELEKYLKSIREESLNVSDSEYWKYDKSKGGKYGGIARSLFQVIRFTQYPTRLINKTLDEAGQEMTHVAEEIDTNEEKGTGIGSKIKSAFSTIGNKIMNFFSGGTGGSAVDEESSNSSTGGKVSIGSNSSDFYKFPSVDTPTSDVNPSRKLKSGKVAPHKGLDMLSNDPKHRIASTTNGTVIAADWGRTFGNTVIVQDDRGMYHAYAHLSSLGVGAGDNVKAGDILGIQGETGLDRQGEKTAWGSHLHYEVGSGFNGDIGSHLTGLVHPGEYLHGYNSGSSDIYATPVDEYSVGSFWNGSSSSTNKVGSSGSTTSSSGSSSSGGFTNILSALYSPFSQFNSSMKSLIRGNSNDGDSSEHTDIVFDGSTTTAVLQGSDNAEKIWRALKAAGYTDIGAAGIMGNLRAESNLQSNNLQNSYERSLGFTDDSYTKAVDSGSYGKKDFVHDAAGYGLAQWTYWDRKEKLYNAAKKAKSSIGDIGMQVNLLKDELQSSYPSVDTIARDNGATLRQVSDAMMVDFENPADQSASAKAGRAKLGQEVYNKYKGVGSGEDDLISRKFNTVNGGMPPATMGALANMQIVGILNNALTYLMQIANNTKSSADNLIKLNNNTPSTPTQTPTKSTGSASNSEMYDLANKSRTDSRSSRAYTVAKAIAQGF